MFRFKIIFLILIIKSSIYLFLVNCFRKRKIEIYSREEAINLIKKFRFEDPVPVSSSSMLTLSKSKLKWYNYI